MAKNERAKTALRDLVASLPPCVQCGRPATATGGDDMWCDEHEPDGYPEMVHAPALRQAVGVLADTDTTAADASPQAAHDYPALHEQNSALLLENGKLKRALAEVEADRDGWRKAWNEKAAAVDRRVERLELVKAALPACIATEASSNKSAEWMAIAYADAAMAALDGSANGQAGLDGSAVRRPNGWCPGYVIEEATGDRSGCVCDCPECERVAKAALAAADEFEQIANAIEHGAMKPATVAMAARQSAKRLRGGQ